MLNQFILNDKKARLQLRLPYLPYERGGLLLPNLKLYYWAAQLRTALYYFSVAPSPAWVTIEEISTPGLPLKLYLYSSSIRKLVKQTKKTHKQLLSVHPPSKIEEVILSHMDGRGQFSLF